jgi:DNA-binding response OmpR family regulator
VIEKKILIVDDDLDIQITLTKRLESHGFHCTTASTIDSALRQLETEIPNLIILDLGFRGANGTAFLQNVKHHLPVGSKAPPILILSCYNDKEIVDFVLGYGAVGFLAKPYDPKTLLATIQNYMGA